MMNRLSSLLVPSSPLLIDDSEISGIIDLLLLHRKSKIMYPPCSSDGSMEHHLTCFTRATSETAPTSPITHGLYDSKPSIHLSSIECFINIIHHSIIFFGPHIINATIYT